MISNTASSPILHGGGITLDTIRRPTDVGNRRTKIICTLGPACWSETNLAALMDAGMNVARFNFSHGDHKGHGEVLDRLRKVAAQKARNIGTLIHNEHCAKCRFSLHSNYMRFVNNGYSSHFVGYQRTRNS